MRIAIVNNLLIAVEALRRIVTGAPQHSLAWIARDGAEAVRRCAEDRPDLILMDLVMPVMDGVEATRRIMAATPCPILVVTATASDNSGRMFEALGAGALDAINTPALGVNGTSSGAAALLGKIAVLAQLTGPSFSEAASAGRTTTPFARTTANRIHRNVLVAIGSSAGGPAALAEVLRELPKGFPGAIVVVQHLDAQFAEGLADWLGQQIALPVRLAREGEAPAPGAVLIAGRDEHLILKTSQTLAYTPLPLENSYRPSVDVFFRSIASHWCDDALGIVLTGMGRDGAIGLKKMRDAGFPTLAQDKASCAVYGMPKAAAELGGAAQVLPLAQIGSALRRFVVAPPFESWHSS
jgi:two-component system response regulator WspF